MKKFLSRFLILMAVAFIFLAFSSPVSAATPLYYPGETLNPTCAPTNPDCTVSSILDLGNNASFTKATMTTAIMTNGTSTGSFFANILSSVTATLTNIFTDLITAVSGIFTNLTATNATTTNATTTNLTVINNLNLPNIGSGVLLTGANGLVSASNATNTRAYLGLSYANPSDLVNPGYQFATWGDSLTGAYTPYLATILGPVYNGGVGSETANQVQDRMLAATTKHNNVTVIWVGANNDMLTDTSTIATNIDAMVSSLDTPKRFVVVSVDISSTYTSNTPQYIQMKALNSYLEATYPNNYLDIRSYLVDQFNSDIPEDVTNHNNDVPPSSIRLVGDSIHLTPAGYLKVAQQIANFIVQKYYVSNSDVVRQSDLLNIFSSPFAIGSVTSSPGRFTSIVVTGKGDETGHLSRELADATGWTSAGWTGSFAAGFTHTTGTTSTLSRVVNPNILSTTSSPQTVLNKKYQVSFSITTSTAGSVSVSFADVDNSSFNYTATTRTYYFSPTAASTTGNLIFTPTSDFNGAISNISVKEISASYPSPLTVLDTQGNSFLDIRGSSIAMLANTFIGQDSGKFNVTGGGNTALGTSALPVNTSGNYNTAIGGQSLYNNTVGYNNTASGYTALSLNTTGFSNTANGAFALTSNIGGNYNTAVGMNALAYNSTSSNNTAVGYNSLRFNTGDNNTSVGYFSLTANISGIQNTANGAYSLNSNFSNYNTANGAFSLYFNTYGTNNSAFGRNALYNNSLGNNNNALGAGALYYNTTGSTSTAIGTNAMSNNATGNSNVAVGDSALWQNVSGSENTIIGVGAVRNGLSATGTTAVGYNAGYGTSPNSSQYNALFGNYAGFKLSTGSWNTILGTYAGYGLSAGDNNSTVDSYLTLIGAQTSRDSNTSSSVAITKSTALGYNAKVGGSFMMALGGMGTSAVLVGIGTSTPNAYLNVYGSSSAQTLIRVATSTNNNIFVITNTGAVGIGTSTPAFKFQVYIDGSNEGHVASTGAWANTSDERLKKNIITLDGALEEVMKLRGVKYDWRANENANNSATIGFIAQEVEKVFPQFVDTGTNGIKGVAYGAFTPVLLQAIKEIQTEILGLAQNITSVIGNFQKMYAQIIFSKDANIENGVTTKDKTTGESYCMYVDQGVTKTAKGDCSQISGEVITTTQEPTTPAPKVETETPATPEVEAPVVETPVAEVPLSE